MDRKRADRKRRRAWPRRLAWAAGITAAVLLGLVVLLRLWARMPALPPGRDPSGETSAGSEGHVPSGRKKGVYTFLVAGRDVASGATDTILFITYDSENKTLRGMNLPRDTMVNVGTRSKRLNAVFTNNRGKDKELQAERGMTALKREVEKLTGVLPDFYVLVEWDAVGELVEALGGVEFEVPFDMDYDDPAQDLHIHQKAGLRTLSGRDAMEVIRWRKNNTGPSGGDLARLKIQQDFLKAAAAKCLRPSTFLKIPQLAEAFTRNVSTDLTVRSILGFAESAYGMDPDEAVTFETAPVAGSFRFKGASLVTLDGEKLLALVNEKMNPYTENIRLGDLELLVRRKDGSFTVTGGTLAKGIPGASAPVPAPRPEEPAPPPEKDPEPAEPEQPEPEQPAPEDPEPEQPGPEPPEPESQEPVPPDDSAPGPELPEEGGADGQDGLPAEIGR